jgi:hypothetical protein
MAKKVTKTAAPKKAKAEPRDVTAPIVEPKPVETKPAEPAAPVDDDFADAHPFVAKEEPKPAEPVKEEKSGTETRRKEAGRTGLLYL